MAIKTINVQFSIGQAGVHTHTIYANTHIYWVICTHTYTDRLFSQSKLLANKINYTF